MFCPNCGAQLPDGSSFCGKCGNQLGTAPTLRAPDAPATGSSVPYMGSYAASGNFGAPISLTPGKIVSLVALAIVLILSFLPWVDLSTIHVNYYGAARDAADAFRFFGAESSYSLWSLPSLGDLIDAYNALSGYSSDVYGPVLMGLLGVFIAFLVLAAIGVVRFVITDKRLVMIIGLSLLLLFSAVFFYFFVLGRMGGVIPVILFFTLSCIAGIIGGGLDVTK